jgi:HD-GYP domain-containing protein (c-di-GMP phosphodiesterase class II)
VRAIEARDPSARAHGERVAALASRMAVACGWSDERRARLVDAALLHEVGGAGEGPGVSVLAADIAAEVLSPEQVSWIRGHRERWDGEGGPDRCAGRDIPEGARIVAAADRWDELTAPPPAGRGLEPAAALELLRRDGGASLCPDAVAALVRVVAPEAGGP